MGQNTHRSCSRSFFAIFIVKTKPQTPTSFCWANRFVVMLLSDWLLWLSLDLLTVQENSFAAAIVSTFLININCTPYLTPLSSPNTSLAFGSHWCLICLTADGTRLLERRASDLWSVGSDGQHMWKYPGWPFIHAPVPFSLWHPCVSPWFKATRCCSTLTNMLQMEAAERGKTTPCCIYLKTPLTSPLDLAAWHIFSLITLSPPGAPLCLPHSNLSFFYDKKIIIVKVTYFDILKCKAVASFVLRRRDKAGVLRFDRTVMCSANAKINS